MNMPEKVIQIVADELKMKVSQVTPESSFEEMGADELHMLEITMALESETGIAVPYEDSDRFHKVGDIIRYLARMK